MELCRCLTGARVRNARRANAEQAEMAVTAHASAEIVALADANRIVIGTVERWIGLKKGWEAYQKLIFLSEMVCLDFGHSNSARIRCIQIVRAIPTSDTSNLKETTGTRTYLT